MKINKTITLFSSLAFTSALCFGVVIATSQAKEVKVVRATEPVNLSTLTADYVANDGDVLTGTLGEHYKISVADGATVTLSNATIDIYDELYTDLKCAGIELLGDATLILSGTNKISPQHKRCPAIRVLADKTVTIDADNNSAVLDLTTHSLTGGGIGGGDNLGDVGNIIINKGTINVNAGNYAAAIGGSRDSNCGTITINGGTVTATGGTHAAGIGSYHGSHGGDILISGGNVTAVGGNYSAGIGSGHEAECDNITITGGTVTATGGFNSPGIGSGNKGSCGNITINKTVTLLTSTKGTGASYSVGQGNEGSCGTITIGGKTSESRTEETFTYPLPHTHNFTYSKFSNNTILATCLNDDCPLEGDELKLTLQEPTNPVFDGTNKVCSFAAGYSEVAFGTPSIEYYENDSLVSECIDAGTYEARVTVEGVTASLEFEITQATPSYVVPTGLASTYGNKLSSVTLPSGWTWKNPNDLVGNAGDRTHVAIYTPTDPNYHSVEENVTIAVAKANPTYVVPSGLRIRTNSTLSMLSLPTGFAWADPTQNVGSTAGNFTFKANYTPSDTDNYNVVNNIDIPVEVYVHEHNWSYVANSSSILASCSNPECPVTSGLTLSLVAPTNLIFDGSAKTASFEDDYNSEAFGTPSIEYYKNNSLVSECVNAGTYEARVTVGGVTSKLQFEITQATPTGYDIPTGLEAVYGDKLSSVALPEHWSWKNPNDLVGNAGNQNHIAIYTPEDPNYKAVEENVTISVSKANPTYVVPSTIDAPYNVELSTIGLPEGFSWMDGSQKTSIWGENAFKAKYTPSDTVNYNMVENIDIKVNVKWVLVDPTEGDVTVTINDGETEYNVDISVKVEVKTEVTVDEKRTEYASIGREFIKQDEDINAIYSVKLIRTVDGVEQEIQPSDIKEGTKIIVSMPVPEELVGKSFRLLEIFSTTEAKEMENYALSKDGKTLVVEVDRMGEFAFLSHTDVPNGFDYSTGLPGWAIALIIVGSILLLCLLCFFLLFFVFNKWIRKDDKALRAVKFGKKDNKVRLLVMPFKFEYREESQIFNSKSEALK